MNPDPSHFLGSRATSKHRRSGFLMRFSIPRSRASGFSHPPTRTSVPDARVGGKWLMTNQCEGMELEGIGEYLEIDRPRRLVFTFCILQFGPDLDKIVVEIQPDRSSSSEHGSARCSAAC